MNVPLTFLIDDILQTMAINQKGLLCLEQGKCQGWQRSLLLFLR